MNFQSSQFHIGPHVSTVDHSTERIWNNGWKIELILTFASKRNQNMVHFSARHKSFSGVCSRSLRLVTAVPGVQICLYK